MKKDKKENGSGFSLSKLSKGAFVAIACIFAVLVILVGVIFGVFFAMKTSGRLSMENRREEELTASLPEHIDDPSVITYQGKRYYYKKGLITFIFMGIDTPEEEKDKKEKETAAAETEPAEKPHTTGDGGQADVILVVALDEKTKKASVISVDRNSMAYFESFDADGNSLGVHESQLALSYAFGDGAHTSCAITKAAVSDFMYEVPIHAYYSMNLRAVKTINDAVGGVPVTIPIDMTGADESFAEGAQVLLDGELAEKFLIARQNVGDGSNRERLERHKIYLSSFISTAVDAIKKDITLPKVLYEEIAENSCTDLGIDEVVYLADLVAKVDVSFYSIPGTTSTDGTFAEFRPDPDEFWKLILDIFYICEDDKINAE